MPRTPALALALAAALGQPTPGSAQSSRPDLVFEQVQLMTMSERTVLIRSATSGPRALAQVQIAPQLRCRQSQRREVGQYLGTLAGAWAGGLFAWKVFDDPFGPERQVKGDWGYTPNANTAFAIGSWLGATGMAVALAPRGVGCRPFLTAVGTAIPTIVLLFGRHEPFLPLIGVVVVAPFQALGGVTAH